MADYYTSFSCLLDVKTSQNVERALEIYLSDEGDEPFSEGFLAARQPDAPTKLWISDPANGDPERVIRFVRLCGAEFGLTGRWGFAWAETCSKPRFEAFGGGAHVLDLATGETLAWLSTHEWLTATLHEGDPEA